VVLVGVMIVVWVLPYGLWWFARALLRRGRVAYNPEVDKVSKT